MKKIIVLIICLTLLLVACPLTTYAGNIDLLYDGSNIQGVKSQTIDVGFSDNITSKLDVSGYYRKGAISGVVTQDEGEIGLNYDPPINDRWSLWLDERVGYNKMLGMDFENNLGVGLKYYVYKHGETKFSWSSGILYQFTSMDGNDKEGHGRYSHRAKFNGGPVALVYFYQPDMSDSSDYITKFIGDVALAKINDSLSIFLHYKNEYRSLYGRSEKSGIKLRFEY